MSITAIQQDKERSGTDTILGMVSSFALLGIMLVCYMEGIEVGIGNIIFVVGGANLLVLLYMLASIAKQLELKESRCYVLAHNVATFIVWLSIPTIEVGNLVAVAIATNIILGLAIVSLRYYVIKR